MFDHRDILPTKAGEPKEQGKALMTSETLQKEHYKHQSSLSKPTCHKHISQRIQDAFEDITYGQACHIWEHASLLFENFDWHAAVHAFHSLARKCSHPLMRSVLFTNVGIIKAHLGEYGHAEYIFRTAVHTAETRCLHYFLAGNAAYEQDLFREARDTFRECIAEFKHGQTEMSYRTFQLDYILIRSEVIQNEQSATYEMEHEELKMGVREPYHRTLHRLPGGRIFESPTQSEADMLSSSAAEVMNHDRGKQFLRDTHLKRSSSRRVERATDSNSLFPPMTTDYSPSILHAVCEERSSRIPSKSSASTEVVKAPDIAPVLPPCIRKRLEKLSNLMAHRKEWPINMNSKPILRQNHGAKRDTENDTSSCAAPSPRMGRTISPTTRRPSTHTEQSQEADVPYTYTMTGSGMSKCRSSSSREFAIRSEHMLFSGMHSPKQTQPSFRHISTMTTSQGASTSTESLDSFKMPSTPSPSAYSQGLNLDANSSLLDVSNSTRNNIAEIDARETTLLPMVYRPPVPDAVIQMLSHLKKHVANEVHEPTQDQPGIELSQHEHHVPYEGMIDDPSIPLTELVVDDQSMHTPGSASASIYEDMPTPQRLQYARSESLRQLENRDPHVPLFSTEPVCRRREGRDLYARNETRHSFGSGTIAVASESKRPGEIAHMSKKCIKSLHHTTRSTARIEASARIQALREGAETRKATTRCRHIAALARTASDIESRTAKQESPDQFRLANGELDQVRRGGMTTSSIAYRSEMAGKLQ